MAKLTLLSLTCVAQQDWFTDDDIEVEVDGDSVWQDTMETGQTRDLGGIEVDFEGSTEVRLSEKNVLGDDNLGKVTIDEDKAGDQRVAKFEDDGTEYKLAYRVDAEVEIEEEGEDVFDFSEDEGEDEGEWWLDEGEDVFDFTDDENLDEAESEPDDVGPTGEGAPDDPVEPCPLGSLKVTVQNSDGALVAGALVEVSPDGFAMPSNFDGTVGPYQLSEGVYTVEVSKDGYLPDPFALVAVITPGVDVELVAVIDAPKFGVSIQTNDVACPGQKHEVKAVVNKPGGTFAWTVESGNVRLVDSSGNPTNSGDTVFVQGLEPQTVKLSVRYTMDWREATDSKTIKIHEVTFSVSNFTAKRGVSWAYEKAGGLLIDSGAGKATFAMDPKVTIHIDGSCPRQTDCAQNFQVGWLQTVRSNDCLGLYPNTKITDTIPLPIRDAVPPDSQPPFYDGAEVQTFFGDGDNYAVHIEDSPNVGPTPWTDPRPAGGGNLESVTMKNSFTAYLAAQNMEWANDVSVSDSLIYLKHISWRCGMKVSLDHNQAVGSRANKRSERAQHWGSGKGQGGTSADLAPPVANTSNVHAQNPR